MYETRSVSVDLAPHGRPARRIFATKLTDEIRIAVRPTRLRWRERGLFGFPCSVIGVLAVIVLWVGRDFGQTVALVDRLSAVRLTESLLSTAAKTPLSLFAPAYGLPLIGAMAQVAIAVSFAEVHLGARRLVTVGIGIQAVVNLTATEVVRRGHGGWFGIAVGHLGDRDTGPSVAVVALGLGAACFARTYLIALLLAISVALATVMLPDRAGREHVVGIVVGAAAGVAFRMFDEHRRRASETRDHAVRRRRARRIASAAVALAGVIAVVSATTRPLAARFRVVVDALSLATATTATGVVAASGAGLILLAIGLRRGHLRAWQLSMLLLAVAAAGHVLKGGDIEEASLSVAAGTYLFVHRDAFHAINRLGTVRHSFRSTLVGLVGTFLGGFLVLEAATLKHHHRLRAYDAAREVARDMRDRGLNDPNPRLDEFLRPALFGIGVAIVGFGVWRAFRPALAQRKVGTLRVEEEMRARSIVLEYGGGTLDYFALRHDKYHFFHGKSMVSYAVYSAVCLVSPDPIGPTDERDDVWAAFRRFADDQGWTVAVLGASQDWLSRYETHAMTTLYVGDEAIVDVQSFALSGGERKSLRQAVNRVARAGYTLAFYDPANMDATLQAELRELMRKSRRGGVERGFSMTLGRIFEPADRGLLLAVCSDSTGRAAAFCQFVPSPGVNGWSLDLMRRDLGEHPNGLLDFVLVETIRKLQADGQASLGLNFATMRAVLAGENGRSVSQRVQRWVLLRLSVDLQIASLWHFNAKYGPRWEPRYAVVDGTENTIATAIAVARAEGMWDLPLVGRWFRPKITTVRSS